ncbi:30S ribosomal protein S17 [Spiribacter curvatus]|uniref:Small ribosomal subunit protein uS17 n=1 Tax=Spiribacter curvatus TaxID=1335757 RepID=U5T155_9GAMM|nr:30S ribosomal protein S17 [Spiribacter curvatus]AGY91016.1 30S ribosomal protein S17 [Spiribacter curvatus]
MSKNESVKRTVNGRVVSTAMDKTITVVVERLVPHPLYGKYIRRTTKVHAHDEENVCQKGDWVSVVECRPVSKQKTWQLVDVLERPAQ